MNSSRSLALLVGAAMACAGPQSDDDPVEPTPDARLPDAAAEPASPCALLTVGDVAMIAQTDVGEPAEESFRRGTAVCTWSSLNPPMPVLHLVVRYGTPMPTHREIVEDLVAEGDAEVIEGVGDFALHISGSLHVWANDTKLQLTLVPSGSIDDLRTLAARAVDRLPEL